MREIWLSLKKSSLKKIRSAHPGSVFLQGQQSLGNELLLKSGSLHPLGWSHPAALPICALQAVELVILVWKMPSSLKIHQPRRGAAISWRSPPTYSQTVFLPQTNCIYYLCNVSTLLISGPWNYYNNSFLII